MPSPSTPPGDGVERRAQRLLPGFLATGMSAFVALVVTVVNTGIDGGLPWRWLLAWLLAWPAAVVAAYGFRPLAWRAAVLVARRRRAPDPP
ncbi:DUF2798 domain-containing protein [Cognatiluteimonas profundi]|uniref:DUF2798 domain-containing protein n=1 Tax=Cognatiluteimonas profundi TaxID=2594501 RepID=UPI00131EA266|nr:DUF2798 domain-containing protein [Lysobacter profundi]